MPITYMVTDEPPVIRVAGSGPSTLAEVLRVIADVAAAGDRASRFLVLADMRELRYGPPLEEAREVAKAMRALTAYQRARIAILCPDLMQLGLARFVAAIASQDGVVMESFRDADLAETWLHS